jgi:1,4-dihydroxy-2-naphthoate octaprenyltransferase
MSSSLKLITPPPIDDLMRAETALANNAYIGFSGFNFKSFWMVVWVTEKLSAWLALSRPPFHSVGLLPFLLGSVLAHRVKGIFYLDIFVWGVLVVVFIMLATYFSGEYWDFQEDSLSRKLGRNRFSGGSQVLQKGLLPRHAALWASIISLILAVGSLLVLQIGYLTGPWTIPLGILGIIGGFFYSTKPLRWVNTGLGELWIALCYGWLPVASSYYLQIKEIHPIIQWISIPIGLTIFNVILLNEFPDYHADRLAGKRNLVVRIGRKRASNLYCLSSIGSWIAMVLNLSTGVSISTLLYYTPFFLLSLYIVNELHRGSWNNDASLERICAMNLVVNLGTTSSLILGLVN